MRGTLAECTGAAKVGGAGFSDDAAWKRIQVAGDARRVPALLEAIAEGRLHLSGACEIAAHLTPENAERLLADVTHKTKEQIKVVVAALAPRPDLPEKVTPIAQAPAEPPEMAPAKSSVQVVASIDAPLAPAQVAAPTTSVQTPLSPSWPPRTSGSRSIPATGGS